MFIWRDDKIGNQMAEAVLNAADGGVKVYISVDRYGVVLEKCEESKKSFFHKKISLIEKIKINTLKLLYPKNSRPGRVKDEHTEIYRHIKEHPNIDVSADVFKADHSKYYIIDEEVLFLGGINIEDKENGCDINGRFYGDYMVKLCGTGKRRSCYCDHSRKSQFSKRQQQADGQKTAKSNKRTNCGLSLPPNAAHKADYEREVHFTWFDQHNKKSILTIE